jgi:hypothetical protein
MRGGGKKERGKRGHSSRRQNAPGAATTAVTAALCAITIALIVQECAVAPAAIALLITKTVVVTGL